MLQSLASTRQGGGIALCGILGEGDETGVTPNIMYGAKKGMSFSVAYSALHADRTR